MKEKERYSVIMYSGYGCVEVFTSESFKEASKVCQQYEDYNNGSAFIYNNVTDVKMDAYGNLAD